MSSIIPSGWLERQLKLETIDLTEVPLGRYLALGSIALGLFLWSPWQDNRSRVGKPLPSPKGYPIVGVLPDLPPQHPWLKFHEWITEHGPVVQLNIMGQSHILLGSEPVIDDLVRQRGLIYNSRPHFESASILTNDLNMLLMPSTKGLRERRAVLGSVLSRTAASNYEPFQWLESYRMIRDIVENPKDYHEILDHWSTATGSRMLFGRAMPKRDGFQREIMDVTHTVEETVQPGAYLVDTLPWMKYIPDFLAPWKRKLKALQARDESVFWKLWNATKEDIDAGRDVPSWAKLFIRDLEEGKRNKLTEIESVHLIGVVYTAFGTSSANIKIFIFAMVRHPEWWARITEEMDAAVGNDRLPSLDDLANLPILRAVMNEVTRLWPVTPGGVPHLLTKDDTYKGYHLPAGSIIHLVTYSSGRDPNIYPDPETFNPQRWLDASFPTYQEPLSEFPTIHGTAMFGAGRRQCPGMLVGVKNVYIQVMLLVWACEISRKRNAQGEEIVPPLYDFVHGFNVFPKPFEFELKARSEERLKKVEAEYERALACDPMRD